jgi:adenylate cyclase
LEGLNKHLGTNILASRDLHKRVERQLVSRLAGHFRFKGFYQVVEVHELLGQPEVEAQTRPWREAFAAALHKFQRRDFAGAERGFRAVLELRPEDGPSGFYLERIPDLRTRKLPDDWTGEIDLADK